MFEPRCGVPEERWVDWHLRRLPADAAAAMERHLAACPECRRVHRQWGEWLGTIRKEGLPEAGECLMPEAAAPLPSERVRARLRSAVIRRSWRKRLAKKPYYIAAAGMIAAVLLFAAWLYQGMPVGKTVEKNPAALEPVEYARLHEPVGAALMEQPDTLVFTASSALEPGLPDTGGRGAVTVWVNSRTDEIFVLIDGMLPAESRDIQAWGFSRHQLANLGLLEFHQSQGHLYSQIFSLPELEELSFTIEPKGGSQQPTAPETAKLRLFAGS